MAGPSALNELLGLLEKRPAAAKREFVQQAHAVTKERWVPNPGPQTDAYLSDADILLYGGQAGGGKSQLMLGWGVNEASSGIIFRRELTQTDGLENDGKKIIGQRGWNGQDHEWTFGDGRTLKLGGMRDANSWMAHAGRERDFYGFDEAGEFLEIQVASLSAWLRAPPGKRTRVVLASNPPRTSDGYWMLDWFGPWIDEEHPLYPTEPGKLLWACYVSGADPDQPGTMYWVEGPGEYIIDDEPRTAKSYTFIPASLEDNPFRNTPEYRAQLQNLPEPLRSQLLKGDFKAGLADQAYQVIPSAWVRAAQRRWKPEPPDQIPMCAIGVDPSGGSTDDMTMAPRFDSYFARIIKVPAKNIPEGKVSTHQGGLIIAERRDGALPVIDMGGGYGGGIYNHLNDNEIECYPYKGAEATTRRTEDKKFTFWNVRAAAYWALREALNPDQPGGSPVQLPPDKRLLAGLCAPTYKITARGIQITPKTKNEGTGEKGILEILGWSPNEADAVVMANWAGPRMSTHALEWIDGPKTGRRAKRKRGTAPQVILGHRSARRRR